MSQQIYAKKTLHGLQLTQQSDYYDRLKIGDEVQVTIKKPRNILFHKKFFALLSLVFKHQNQFDDFETFRAVFIMNCGFYEEREIMNFFTGNVTVTHVPKSISFAKMDELEFEELFNKGIDLADHLLGSGTEEIRRELEQFY